MNEKDKKECMDQLARMMSAIHAFDTGEKMTVVDLMVFSQLFNKPGTTLTETIKAFPEVPASTVQYSFVSFDRMNLIVKKPHPSDYKAKAIYLSTKGEKLAGAMFGACKG